MDSSGQIDVVFIDFSKAFDVVCHDILLTAKRYVGGRVVLLDWCKDYLTRASACNSQRKGFELANCNLWCPPKVLCWDHFIFIVYMNDLAGVISKGSSIALYADDSKIYRVMNTQDDLTTFQSEIYKISEWCKMNKMTMNTTKCNFKRITRKKIIFSWRSLRASGRLRNGRTTRGMAESAVM